MKIGVRELVFVVLLTGIPVLAWLLVFRSNSAQNEAMLRQIEAKQAKLQALNRATGTIGDLKKEIVSLEEAIGFFRSKLPNEKEIDKVLQDVWRLADANKLRTKSIRTTKPENGAGAARGPQAEQPITMKLEGDFLGFYAFLLALEAQPRITQIHQMTLKKMEKAAEGRMQAEFVMSIFFEPDKRDG